MASSASKCRGCPNKANSFCYMCGDFTTVAQHRGGLNKVISFCYVYGDFTTVAQRRTITSLLRTAYFHYFD